MLFTKVVETCATAGTGTQSLGGPSGLGNRSFAAAAGSGNKAIYYRESSDGSTWELGWGVVTAGPPDTLTRNLIASSTGALIAWTSASTYIYSTPPAEVMALLLSCAKGSARPDWLPAGGAWTKDNVSPWERYLYDGTNDLLIGTVDPTNHAFAATAYSAQAAATEGPAIEAYRDRTGVAADQIGLLRWAGKNGSAAKKTVAKLLGRWDTVTAGAEDASVEAHAIAGGALTKIFEWGKRLLLFRALETAKGAAVASAATCDIWAAGDGNLVHITGTTTITSFGTAPQAGAWRHIIFDGALTLTHGASAIVLPGGANITTAAGDEAWVFADTTTKHLVHYQKADGTAVAAPASQAEMEAATDTTKPATPGRVQYHPGVAKAWCKTLLTSGTPSAARSYNISSITDNGVGDITYNFTTAFSDGNYTFAGMGAQAGSPYPGLFQDKTTAPTATACRVHVQAPGVNGAGDYDHGIVFFGDQ